MIIGKIDYINLLPFYVFLKRKLRNDGAKKALEFYKGVPSVINRQFIKRRVEAAVISSIVSPKYRCSDFGIVAYKKVQSVLICPGQYKEDTESNTSNILAKVLDVTGEVYIGDKALAKRNEGCQDLATLWYEKTKLPFVFARFCYHCENAALYERLAQEFLKSHVKVPSYILRRYAKRSGVPVSQIKKYLWLIHYSIGPKEKKALKKFLKLARKKR